MKRVPLICALVALVLSTALLPATSGASTISEIKIVLPSVYGHGAAVTWLPSNGRVYVVTEQGYLIEMDQDLNILREINLGTRPHMIGNDGTYLYILRDQSRGKVFKVLPTEQALEIVATTGDTLRVSGYSEGITFVNGRVYAVWKGGSYGQLVMLDQESLALLGSFVMNEKNHGLATDGQHIFLLGVQAKDCSLPDVYYKLTLDLQLVEKMTFPWNGCSGGNVYFNPNGDIYVGAGRLTRVDPDTLTVVAGSDFIATSAKPLHWLTADNNWVYALDEKSGYIRVFDPTTLQIVYTHTIAIPQLHFGVVQNNYLWAVGRATTSYVARYDLYPTTP